MSNGSPEDFMIAIPALNEAGTIDRVVREALEVSRNICVVDDGSTDDTAVRAAAAGAHVIRHETTGGLGLSLSTAFHFAGAHGFRHVVTIDGDGAHNCSRISALVKHHLKTGAGLTIGSRLIGSPPTPTMPSQKFAANIFATSLVNATLETSVSDAASGIRVISEGVFTRLARVHTFAISFELIRTAKEHGLTIAEHPTDVRYDARELLATTRPELLDLLRFCDTHCGSSTLREELRDLLQRADNLLPFTRDCSGVRVYAHPLQEHDSFFFQKQHPWFEALSETNGGQGIL